MLEKNCPIEVFADKLRRRSSEDQSYAQGDSSNLSPRQLIDINNRAAEALAKEMGLWIDFSDVCNLGTPAPSGMENEVYLNSKGNLVYKVNNLMLSHSVGELLNRLMLHNAYFPQTRYDLYGFTGFGRGSIYPIIVQDYIEDVTYATPEDIDIYMSNLGFHQVGEARYSDGTIEIFDLRPRNVLKDQYGDIYVVDADFKVI